MIYTGNCLDILPTLPAQSVHCVVTSPPYWGLRDYGHADQLGNERTPAEYVQRMVQVFREVWRVLQDDGTLWLNLGDSYGAAGGDIFSGFNERYSGTGAGGKQAAIGKNAAAAGGRERSTGLRPKNLVGIPWRVAFALQDDGWYLRQDIIWHKPNPMPESVQDRCTKAHEYVFLLTKQPRYYYDMTAIQEAAVCGSNGSSFVSEYDIQTKPNLGKGKREDSNVRNKRSVWTVATAPYQGAHFATMPPKLVEPCILAGCPVGGVVLDPFAGSGTTGAVATSLGRNFVGIELNPAYVELAEERIGNSQPALQFEAQP